MILRTLAAALLFASASLSARADDTCPASTLPPTALPHSRAALAKGGEFLIVALGSSTTQSYMASDTGHSYPAVLQAQLAAALPKAHVAVINRGIGGQDAAEELGRLETDAIAMRPSLVIWQVGANGVLRRTDPEIFKRLVISGVKRMHQARMDVILMDNQRAPMILASADHIKIDQALADVAVATGASLFARGSLMDGWQKGGLPYERFISTDGLHHNDLGYRCVASALSQAILSGLSDPAVGRAPAPVRPAESAAAGAAPAATTELLVRRN